MDGYDMDEAERRANERLQQGDGECSLLCSTILRDVIEHTHRL